MTFLEKLCADHPRFRPGTRNAYLLAVILVGIAVVLRVVVGEWIPGAQFVTLFPVVFVVSLLCGAQAGFFSVVLGTLCAWYFILPPNHSFQLEGFHQLYPVGFFVVVGSLAVIIIDSMRNALARVQRLNGTLIAIFEANPDAILLTDRFGRITDANHRAAEMFATSREKLLGTSIESLMPERFRRRHVVHRAKFMVDPQIRDMGPGLELVGQRDNGGEFPIDVQIGPIVIDGQTLAIATVRDLTEQRRLTDALENSLRQQAVLEERDRVADESRLWADAFQCSAVGMEIHDPHTLMIRFVNPAFAATHEMTVEETVGKCTLDLLYPKEEHGRLLGYYELADRVGHATFETVHLRKDGTTFPVQKVIASVRAPDGEVLYRVASSRDITEDKKIEAALRHAQKMEAIGTVTGGMAHDFNNLLGVIIGNLDLVDPLLNHHDHARQLVTEALDAALRGAELTRSLLAFARRQALTPVHTNLNELVTDMHRLLSRVLGEDIEISLDLAPDLWPVLADRSQIEACITNLATNARDAMPRGGRLTISTGNRFLDTDYTSLYPAVQVGDYATIAISDSGVGMTPDVIARIFEPFFTTKEPGKGTGLGLSMVFGFVSQSSGHVTAYSEPGIGTTIRIFLPHASEGPGPTRSPPAAAPIPGHGETILVVEDNAALRRVVIRQLSGFGYRTLEADNPQRAIELLEQNHIDLLFTDVVMPGGMDGFELAQHVNAQWPEVKVLLTSGFTGASVNDRFEGLPHSTHLLSKPYRREELAQAARNALEAT